MKLTGSSTISGGATLEIAAAQRIVFQDYMHAVQDAEKRRDTLTEQIRELIPEWSMAPVVRLRNLQSGNLCHVVGTVSTFHLI